MKAHWIVMAAGALFLAGAAGVRSARRAFEAPFAGFEKLVLSKPPATAQATPELAGDDPSEFEAPVSMADPNSDPSAALPGIVEVTTSGHWSAELSWVAVSDRLVLVEHFETLTNGGLAETEAQRSLLRTWIAWRRGSIDALPKDLQDESDHRRAIDDQYRAAIRGFLGESVAASYDPQDLDISLINRPPVGGYDIGGIGFTDIDEQAEAGPGFVTREMAHAQVTDLSGELEAIRERERVKIEDLRRRAAAENR